MVIVGPEAKEFSLGTSKETSHCVMAGFGVDSFNMRSSDRLTVAWWNVYFGHWTDTVISGKFFFAAVPFIAD